jgi:hypothetical protein
MRNGHSFEDVRILINHSRQNNVNVNLPTSIMDCLVSILEIAQIRTSPGNPYKQGSERARQKRAECLHGKNVNV